MATDINTALLKDLSAPNLETREHDILTEDLPEAAFDIVHCGRPWPDGLSARD